jgi:YHS domain-containing protein
MNRDSLRVPCLLDPTRIARIEPGCSVRLNWEIFFFADELARARFLRDPLPWCGALTDPVTLQRFVPEANSPQADHAGQIYYFASAENRGTFATDPEKYATVPHYLIGETRKDVDERERRAAEKAAGEAAKKAGDEAGGTTTEPPPDG